MKALHRLYRRVFPYSAAGAGVPAFQCGDDRTHALRLQMTARLLARREARRVSNARAAKGAATKIHQQFNRDPLIAETRKAA